MSILTKEFPSALLQDAMVLFNKIVSPRLTKQNKFIGITLAVSISLAYMIRDRVFKPPKNIRHIPYFGYLSVIKSIFANDSIFDRAYKVNLPFLNSKENKTAGGPYLVSFFNNKSLH
jgi:hypothetical protein